MLERGTELDEWDSIAGKKIQTVKRLLGDQELNELELF